MKLLPATGRCAGLQLHLHDRPGRACRHAGAVQAFQHEIMRRAEIAAEIGGMEFRAWQESQIPGHLPVDPFSQNLPSQPPPLLMPCPTRPHSLGKPPAPGA